jgi:hypothetical protein
MGSESVERGAEGRGRERPRRWEAARRIWSWVGRAGEARVEWEEVGDEEDDMVG